ncbi:sugar phosphate isomerase/epimerase [Actinomyces sp. F1_1611]
MAVLGVQMMMLKEQVAEAGMFAVLERLRELDVDAVEVSQIPMDEANTADLERGVSELGIEVAALSIALEPSPVGADDVTTKFDKIVADCQRLGTRFVRIGMMPTWAMTSRENTEKWAARCQPWAERFAAEGITMCYHNHHVDLAQFDGERIFDIVRRVAPALQFEVDLHWVQRGGMAPLDMLKAYTGVCRLIHVKDYRVVPLPLEADELLKQGDFPGFMAQFLSLAQFAEVGAGNMNWPELLPAAIAAGAEYFLIEQDDTYGRDPFDCIRDSREYLRSIGY